MTDIGKRIRQLREEKGMSQQDLADRVGYKSRASINKIELERDLPITKIARIAQALGTTPEYIMGWDEDTTPQPIMEYAYFDAKKNKPINNNPISDITYVTNDGIMIEVSHKYSELSDKYKKLAIAYIEKLFEQQRLEEEIAEKQALLEKMREGN